MKSQTETHKTFGPSQPGESNTGRTEWSPPQFGDSDAMETDDSNATQTEWFPPQSGDPNAMQTDDPSQSVRSIAMVTEATRKQSNDPIATQTKWEPLESNGIFRWFNKLFKGTRELVRVDLERIEFKAPKVKKICLVVMGVAIFIIIQLMPFYLSKTGVIAIPIPVYFIIVIVAGCLLYFGTLPIVFDKNKGAFWKGWNIPNEADNRGEFKSFAGLAEIHALQLISEYGEKKSSSTGYQLNLVLKDGSRIEAVDYRNKKKLREDAVLLSEFLDKPVWDAIKAFDLSSIEDSIAKQTEWQPAEGKGVSLSSYKLAGNDLNLKEFEKTNKAFGVWMLLLGMFVVAAFIIKFFPEKVLLGTPGIAFGLFGLALLVIGCSFYFGSTQIVFDKYKGAFEKGWQVFGWKKYKSLAKLSDIHALQLIEVWSEETNSYIGCGYQLNVILKDGSRINVFEGGNQKKIEEVAQTLCRFLGKPVWDAIG